LRPATDDQRCTRQWREDDHLSFVAQMRRRWVDALGEVGITTLEQLASAEAELETSLAPHIYQRLRRQAELQHRARITGEHVFELLPRPEATGAPAAGNT
jgi:predicted RecB family nuclease